MPRALAIETSGQTGSVALAEGGVVLDERVFPHGLRHAAGLVPLIDEMCRARGWAPNDIRRVYLSIGPGSFTGLRIGVTLAKTLALATGAGVVAVPSVRVLAANAPADAKNLVVVLDAKRDQIFTARFARPDPTDEWTEVEPAHVDALAAVLTRAPRPMHLLGEGIPYHARFVPSGDAGVIVTPTEAWRARAATVATLGRAMADRGEFADPFRLTPTYIRLPEAEEKALAADRAAAPPSS